MEQTAWNRLLDELNLYIEENYEGTRLPVLSDAAIGNAPAPSEMPPISFL